MAWGTQRASYHVVIVLMLMQLSQPFASNTMCRRVRFATFNTSLNRNKAGTLLQELLSGVSEQAANVSAILQKIRPDVLVLNEFDYEPAHAAVDAFQANFLGVPQAPGLQPLRYPYVYTRPVNTGEPSGKDFDHDGRTDGPADAFGYGFHPGQYGMVLLSQFPIDDAASRTFQRFLYKDMPGALLPTDPDTGRPWYSGQDLQVLRLSSKSHWDVPVDISIAQGVSKRVHMLLHHPTPPAFDGREGRNLLRNHDEIRMFADFVGCGLCKPASSICNSCLSDEAQTTNTTTTSSSSSSSGGINSSSVPRDHPTVLRAPGVLGRVNLFLRHLQARLFRFLTSLLSLAGHQQQVHPAAYLYDDAGKQGGLPAGSSFVIAGDHNADPLDGNSYKNAIRQLLDCCNVTARFTPKSAGGKEAGNKRHGDRTPPETKTATFGLRVDYILPSSDLNVLGGAVFWPVKAQQPEAGWLDASDHRPVYLDVEVCAPAVKQQL